MSEHRSTERVAGIPLESATTVAALEALLAPWRALTDPRFDGFESLPSDGRYLLVGNHTTLGFFDIPFLALDIRRRTGVGIRSLGERQHFRIPVWRRLLSNLGTVNGTRENARGCSPTAKPCWSSRAAVARSPDTAETTIRCSGTSASASRGWRSNTPTQSSRSR